MSVFVPEISQNSISLSFGLKFKLIQIFNNGSKSEIKLIKSSENNTFYGLFDVEDVDFEIVVDNRSNVYGIGFDINLSNEVNPQSFYIKSGNYNKIKALETNGKHLHFISQSTEEGKILVAMSAHKNRTTFEEEAINCSRIGFTIEVEKPKLETGVRGRPLNLYITTLNNKTIEIPIGFNNTIGYLMYRIEDKEGIPVDQQRLIFDGNQLNDQNKVNDYSLQNNSTIHLILRLRGGGDCRLFNKRQLINGNQSDSIDKTNVSPVGERGVVCFGRKTKQCFDSYKGFIPYKRYSVKPFTIELRMKSKYSIQL